MKILVFGGSGFVGLGIAEALLARGDDVVLFDRRPPPESASRTFAALPGQLAFLLGDVGDEASVRSAVGGGADIVIYGAALTADAGREAAEPDRILDVNVGGLVRVLQAVASGMVRRTIVLSSGAAYGDTAFQDDLLDETASPTPRSLYAVSKLAGEQFARRLAELHGLDLRIVRLSTVFGPWEHATGVRDTLSPPYQVALAALEGRPAILPRPCVRDFVYVRDVAGGVIALIDAPAPRHDLYNIGPGMPWNLETWSEGLTGAPGYACRPHRSGEAATIDLYGDRERAVLSIARLTDDLRYTPRFGMTESAQDYDAWLKTHGLLLLGGSGSGR